MLEAAPWDRAAEPAPWDRPVDRLSDRCRESSDTAKRAAREAKPSPLLDTYGTDRQVSENTYLSVLVAGDAPRERRRVAAALRSIDSGSQFWSKRQQLDRRANRLTDCGRYVITYADAQAGVRVVPNNCDDALCNRCAWHRTKKIRSRFGLACAIERSAGRRVRMMTLTQPVISGETWAQSHARLMKQWRGFWRAKETKAKIKGCLRRIETTWSWKHRGWHVHMHVAYGGSFWRTEDLSDTWRRYGTGKIVDVREVYRDAELFKYLMKTAKAAQGSIIEYAIQSAGRRLLDLLGTWRDIVIPKDDDKDAAETWEVCPKQLRRAVADPGAACWILSSMLRRFDSPEPRALARWAARVLSARDREIDKLSEREVRRWQKEHKRSIARLARSRGGGLPSPNEDHRYSRPGSSRSNDRPHLRT